MLELSHAEEASITLTGIDHLLYASSDLKRGMNEIEALLGVRPVRGGHHPQYGTHNALLSLGPGKYLEIIARDPDLPAPKLGALVDLSASCDSHLITWVLRTENIQESATAANRADIGLGQVESGRRTRTDGSEISWQLTDPYAMPMSGAIPFLINWGKATHPSGSVPVSGELVELTINHPEPDKVRRALSVLGVEVKVVEADEFGIFAEVLTENGSVTIR